MLLHTQGALSTHNPVRLTNINYSKKAVTCFANASSPMMFFIDFSGIGKKK